MIFGFCSRSFILDQNSVQLDFRFLTPRLVFFSPLSRPTHVLPGLVPVWTSVRSLTSSHDQDKELHSPWRLRGFMTDRCWRMTSFYGLVNFSDCFKVKLSIFLSIASFRGRPFLHTIETDMKTFREKLFFSEKDVLTPLLHFSHSLNVPEMHHYIRKAAWFDFPCRRHRKLELIPSIDDNQAEPLHSRLFCWKQMRARRSPWKRPLTPKPPTWRPSVTNQTSSCGITCSTAAAEQHVDSRTAQETSRPNAYTS